MLGLSVKEKVRALNITANARAKYTPDIAMLQQRQHPLVFVYDEMMQAHPKYADILGNGSAFAYNGFTQNLFYLFKEKGFKDTRAFIFEADLLRLPKRRVFGELHYAEPETFFKLDEYKENGVQFIRRREKIDIYYSQLLKPVLGDAQSRQEFKQVFDTEAPVILKHLVQTVYAWTYVAVTPYWYNLLDGGYMYELTKHFEPNRVTIGEYYKFTLDDYSD